MADTDSTQREPKADRQERVLDLMRQGYPARAAAAKTRPRVPQGTLNRWQTEPKFLEACEDARAEAEGVHIGVLLSPDAEGVPSQNARWLLARCHGYSEKATMEHVGAGGGAVQVETRVTHTAEQLKAIALAIAAQPPDEASDDDEADG